MPQQNAAHPLITLLSNALILWIILWFSLLLIIPSDQYSSLFFTLGVIPVIGWFAIKPSRVVWFLSKLLGTNGLDK
ncbi:MAG: hypothetical protein RPU34_12695 [Candidatus Sedimenticola sp. (ex Thyasira tokunagai)]